MKRLGIFAMAVLLGACASNTARKDPYAQAAQAKRAEIARLDRAIDSLRALPEAADLAGKIDSLEKRKAIEQANMTGIGGAANTAQSMSSEGRMLDAEAESKHVQDENRKYPIRKP